jgi:hypothetical protein
MIGLVPVISISLAKPCHGDRDRRVKPGDDIYGSSLPDLIRGTAAVSPRHKNDQIKEEQNPSEQ